MSAAPAERARASFPDALVSPDRSRSDRSRTRRSRSDGARTGRRRDVGRRDPAGGGGGPRKQGGRAGPRALASLEVRDYRLFLSSLVVATTGLWMQRIAQDWLVLQLTGSVTAVGIAVALQFLPVLLFGLFGGVIADRYPKR
ncbi:MAG: MFS transporter, partial [Propionibacteriaceae bacterium]